MAFEFDDLSNDHARDRRTMLDGIDGKSELREQARDALGIRGQFNVVAQPGDRYAH
jgi:hypothetical protein